jgi:thymidylate synthase (FAD)
MYTEWVWTGSLLAWAHFIKLRTHEHAQKEIQDFAAMFVPTLEELYPVSWKALMKGYTP